MALIERPAYLLIGAWSLAHGGWKALVIVAWIVFVVTLVQIAEEATEERRWPTKRR